MLGLNGGLLGVRRVPSLSNATGIWTPNEQSLAKQAVIWPSADDPFFANVSLLLHMDGSSGSTTFTDSSPNARTVTAFNNAQISTAESKFGGASALFDGSYDYLTTPYSTSLYDWWTSDYTIEAWVYAASWTSWARTGTSDIPCMIGNSDPVGFTANWTFGPIRSGQVRLFYNNGAGIFTIVTTTTLPTSQWNHIAAVKTSSGVTLYINGVSSGGTFAISGTPQSSASFPLSIGSHSNISINGRIDELRITKGVARYTANFTPPTAPFPDA